MKELEEVMVCTAKLLRLRLGDREYYINYELEVAYEGIEEAKKYECPDGGNNPGITGV